MTFSPGRHSAPYGPRLEIRADVGVLGAGAGGSALAAALAERGLSVAVLEEGRHWEPQDFRARSSFALKHLYQNRGARMLRGNVVMPMPGGRGVGGSTLINSAICFRAPDEVLDHWRDDFGCSGVTRERFGAYYDRIWDTLGIGVNPVAVQRNNNLIFREGAEALGLKGGFMPRSAPGCAGCGICQYGCPSGGKSSVDRTFLTEALASGGVGVYAGCRLREVETQGDRVVALLGQTIDPETQQAIGEVRLEADTFVLSGGPIGSPIFLLANGLADNEHCGRHLVVHPTVQVLARFTQEIRPWSGVTQGYYVDAWDRGFLLQTFTVTPDQYFLLLQTPTGPETMAFMADLAHVASAGALVHDEDSEGRIRWTPAGPDLSYFLGDGDRRRLLEGMRLASEVFFAAGALSVLPSLRRAKAVPRGADLEAAIPLDAALQDLSMYASHPMGTCRMGDDPSASVVDPTGRVWGWSNLHVADASVFPTSLGVNPQVTAMAMGLLVGESIADARGAGLRR